MRLAISARKTLIILVATTVFMAAVHLITQFIFEKTNSNLTKIFLERFSMEQEASIPTWYNQILLFIISALAVYTWLTTKKAKGSYRQHWLWLGLVFLWVGIDEGAMLHDSWVVPMRDFFDIQKGILYFSWVIPAMVGIGLFGLAFFRFWLRLPRRTAKLFALAAIIYVVGGIGLEMIAADYVSNFSNQGFTYDCMVMVEESMEMIGASLMIYALLDFLKQRQTDLRLTLR